MSAFPNYDEACLYINKQCCQSTHYIKGEYFNMRTGLLLTRSKCLFFQNTTKNRCCQSICSPEENDNAFVRTLKLCPSYK